MKTDFFFKATNIEGLNKKVARMNKRAIKNGLPTLEVVVTAEEVVEKGFTLPNGEKVKIGVPYVRGYVQGEAPVVEGWKIAGSIDYTAGFNVLKAFEEVPDVYRDCTPFCDHCSTRRVKKKTVLIKNEQSGEIMQVGTSCLKDFLNTSVADEIYFCNFWTDLQDNIGNDEYFGGRDENVLEVDSALYVAAMMVRNFGFVSTKSYDLTSTALRISIFLFGSSKDREEMLREIKFDDEADITRAKQVKEWVLENQSNNDFFHNLKGFMGQEYMNPRYISYVAGALSAHEKYLGRVNEYVELKNEHLPGVSVKDRVELSLTVKRVTPTEGFYGTTYVHTFHDAEGRTVTWFGSKKLPVDTGETVSVKATIKGFGEYNGRKQTSVTRVALV